IRSTGRSVVSRSRRARIRRSVSSHLYGVVPWTARNRLANVRGLMPDSRSGEAGSGGLRGRAESSKHAAPEPGYILGSGAAASSSARRLAEDRLDDLAAGWLPGRHPLRLHTLGLPEDLGDLLDAGEQVERGLLVDLLLDRGGQLAGRPAQGMED